MRKIQIICDGCGKEIEGNPTKIITEEVERDDEDFVEKYINPEISEKEYCRKCINTISKFILRLPYRPKPAIENNKCESCTGATADTKGKVEETPKAAVKKSVEDAPKAAVHNGKNSNLIKTIKRMILEGYSNVDIAERLEGCTIKSVNSIRYRMKKKGLIPEPVNCDTEHMKKCKYGASLKGSNASNEWYCNYLGITGKRRVCDASQCICYREE